jgi:ribosomal protein L37AE/L43A
LKLSKYRGRPGRQGRVDREGQAWSQDKAIVASKDIFDQPKVDLLPIDHFKCRQCENIVRVDSLGYAFCEECGAIYNDGASWFPTKEESILAKQVKQARMIRACKA